MTLNQSKNFYAFLSTSSAVVFTASLAYYIYRLYSERRAASENCIIDNAHSIVFGFYRNIRKMLL